MPLQFWKGNDDAVILIYRYMVYIEEINWAGSWFFHSWINFDRDLKEMELIVDPQFRARTIQTFVMKMLNVLELKDQFPVNPQERNSKKSTAANAGVDTLAMDIHAMVRNN